MTQTYISDGIEYTKSNHRMRYNPEFHEKHNKLWTMKDIIYLCGMWDSYKKRDIALALGRTEGTCMTKVSMLKKNRDFDRYKKMFKED